MVHDDFSSERYRLERVLDILEDAANRLNARAQVPFSLVRDAVEFIRATEDSAYSATEEGEVDPPLSACVQQHFAARKPLETMERTLAALERQEAPATSEFVRAARNYIQLRRDHLRADDQLFATATGPRQGTPPTVESVETARARRCYARLIEAAAPPDIGGPPASVGLAEDGR